MKEVCAHDIKMINSRLDRLEQDLDDIVGRLSMIGEMWEAIREMQADLQAQGHTFVHTLVYRNKK